jgi:ribonuclease HII
MPESIAGIDEAGRGPVIGSLIVAMAVCSKNNEKKLKKICKKDSKQLSQLQRLETLKKLDGICEFKYIELSAQDLNKKMEAMSLNDIEAQAMANLIKKIKNADVMIDLPDRYSWVFKKRMERFGVLKFEAEHKADENYPIVAAASIFAKVLRERQVDEIKNETLVDFGSGYPSDPKTRNVLRNNKEIKKIDKYLRKKWKTLENVMQKKLFED